jgi:hypothetical protein
MNYLSNLEVFRVHEIRKDNFAPLFEQKAWIFVVPLPPVQGICACNLYALVGDDDDLNLCEMSFWLTLMVRFA